MQTEKHSMIRTSPQAIGRTDDGRCSRCIEQNRTWCRECLMRVKWEMLEDDREEIERYVDYIGDCLEAIESDMQLVERERKSMLEWVGKVRKRLGEQREYSKKLRDFGV